MKVSVIIPIYNTAEYLEKCITSILSQTYQNFELIIINDGSPDNSEEIVNEFLEKKDPRIIYKKFKNGGLSFARNKGLDIAIGDYVIFIDTDDWVDPDFIKDFIENNSSQNKRLVVQDLKEVYPQKIVKNIQGYKNQLLAIPQDFECFTANYRFTQGYAWNKFYDLSIIRKHHIRFVEGPVMNEDELFYMEYLKFIDEVYFISKDNYNYLQRSNSMTSKLFMFTESINYMTGLLSFLKYLNSVKPDSIKLKSYTHKRINHIFDYVLRSSLYGNTYTLATRIKSLKELHHVMSPFLDILEPKTTLQKWDYFLFQKKQFLLLDLIIRTKTKIN